MDQKILNWIQCNQKNAYADRWVPIITALGNGGAVWIFLALSLLLYPDTRDAGINISIALILESVCCNFYLKPLVARPRPCDLKTNYTLLIPRPTDRSFPSGHTAASFAAVSALYLSHQRFWIPALILAILIGYSRLYLYVHFPSDVVAGAMLGVIAGRVATIPGLAILIGLPLLFGMEQWKRRNVGKYYAPYDSRAYIRSESTRHTFFRNFSIML